MRQVDHRQTYLKPGQSINAEQAVYALVTKSANDVAAVAEKLAGTEREFAKRMTRKAKSLGMTRTIFRMHPALSPAAVNGA